MAVEEPRIGHWYERGRRKLFEVVALDERARTIELQHFDGTLEEMDYENWPFDVLTEVSAPEDWSGSVDVNPEDEPPQDSEQPTVLWIDPLMTLDNQ